MTDRQIDFAVRMITQYRQIKQKYDVGVRRLHYYIVSLPEVDRVLPSKGDRTTIYENNTYWFGRLSGHLVRARIEGLIPWDWVIDEKNGPLIPMPDRAPATTTWDVDVPDIQLLPELEIDQLPEWKDWLENITIDSNVSGPVFNNQNYRVVVAIEKATSRSDLEKLCAIYGADLLIFGGQPSVTRIHDVVIRAEDEDKPVMLLYISDLDVSGWDMAPAFFERIQEMYPREDHKMVRVALTREQVKKYNLPVAFDPDSKGKNSEASKTRILNFIKETGGRDCIELDALDEGILIGLLRTQLEKYSGSDDDDQEYDSAVDGAEASQFGLESITIGFQEEYDTLKTEWNEIAQDLKSVSEKYKEKISVLNSRKEEIDQQVIDAIREEYGLEEAV